jgi:hypothetical protein
MTALPKTPHTPMSPGAQAMYDSLMAQLENVEEATREAIISSQETIARFERKYHMTSVEMRRRVIAGEMEETLDICIWSQEIESLDDILADPD